MTSFLNKSTMKLVPYIPGEQPCDKKYIKLNTNECPYPPSPSVIQTVKDFYAQDLRLYPDPASAKLKESIAKRYDLQEGQVFVGGGSDEILAYIFMAFSSQGDKVYFPDVTYEFYKVCAQLFHLESISIPLAGDFSLSLEDYLDLDGNIFIANPNAPTGICMEPAGIEKILQNNPRNLVVVDEAYVDFAPEKSCVSLIKDYDNLLVTQTFSKSRSLAGMRLGFAFGQKQLITGLEKIKFSFNPYNIDRISAHVGIASLEDETYFKKTVKKMIQTREWMKQEFSVRGFSLLPSEANFIFARAGLIHGEELYLIFKEKGILVRHFNKERINQYIRISVGTDEEMCTTMDVLDEMFKEKFEGSGFNENG